MTNGKCILYPFSTKTGVLVSTKLNETKTKKMHLSMIYTNLILPIIVKFPLWEQWSNNEHLTTKQSQT